MNNEVIGLIGKKYKINAPSKDGSNLVQQQYPEALAEGSSGHWTYRVKDVIVAEAWMGRKLWWLRIKGLNENR